MATALLYSNFHNVSGGTLFFGFLGSHGMTLTNGAAATMFGDIFDHIIGRRGKLRSQTAFQNALNNGLLELTHTPAVVLYDGPNVNSKMLNLSSGTLGVIDPQWGQYSGTI